MTKRLKIRKKNQHTKTHSDSVQSCVSTTVCCVLVRRCVLQSCVRALAFCVLAQGRKVQNCVSALYVSATAGCAKLRQRDGALCVSGTTCCAKLCQCDGRMCVSATARLSEHVAQTKKALTRHHTHAAQLSRNLKEYIQEMGNHYLNII